MKKKLISKCKRGEKVRDLNSQLLVKQSGPRGVVDTYDDGVVQLNLPTIYVRPEGVELTDQDRYRQSYENLIYTLRSNGYNNLAEDVQNVGQTQGIGNALYHYQDIINRRSELLKSKGAHWDENEAKRMGVAAMSAPYAPLAAIGAGKFAGNIIGNIVNNPIGFVADMAIGTGTSKVANKISEIRTGKDIYERAQERHQNDPVKATLSGMLRDPGTYVGFNTALRGKNAYKLSKNIIEAGGIKNYRIAKAITNGLDTATPVFKKPSLQPRIIPSSTTPAVQTGSNNKLWDQFRIKSSERPSYLSEAERMGVPKGERNQAYNPRLLQLDLRGSYFDKDKVPVLFGDVFGKHLGTGANKQTFMSAQNPSKVLKVDIWHGTPHNEDIMTTVLPNQNKNKAPFYKKTKYKGYIYDDYRKYPIYEQDYIPSILTVDDFDPVKIKTQFAEYGYIPASGTDYHYTPEGFRDADYFGLQFVNPKTGIEYMDLRPDNMTLQNGRYYVFDMDSFQDF